MYIPQAFKEERLEGKWNVSQNRSEADRSGGAAGLRAGGAPGQLAMADECEPLA